MSLVKKAVLLVGFGGPSNLSEVDPFLQSVSGGRIPAARLAEVRHHYEAVGGRSPYNEITERQKKALEKHGAVYIGYRHLSPSFEDAWRGMLDDGVTDVFGFILSPLKSFSSYERYIGEVDEARQKAGAGEISLRYSEPFYAHPLFVSAQAKELKKTLKRAGPPPETLTIFSAHSIPSKMADDSGYARQFFESAFAVSHALDLEHWVTAYQSRSGPPQEPWLGPDVTSAIERADTSHYKSVVIVPIGFLCDNVEVIYDLDVEAKAVAEKAGLRYFRASTVADHPDFIRMIVEEVSR